MSGEYYPPDRQSAQIISRQVRQTLDAYSKSWDEVQHDDALLAELVEPVIIRLESEGWFIDSLDLVEAAVLLELDDKTLRRDA